MNSKDTSSILHEDEHLLVVDKPSGWNTHSPTPFTTEGMYEWLRNQSPERNSLATMHRLDKGTSGLLLFGKTREANRSLTLQFEKRLIQKKYVFRTHHAPPFDECLVESEVRVRLSSFQKRNTDSKSMIGITRFRVQEKDPHGYLVEAIPRTGRTHQIRYHAAELGIPILGDSVYGGHDFSRLCLHACELVFKHPVNGQKMHFASNHRFDDPVWFQLRETLFESEETDAYRLFHGASDGRPGLFIDRWGQFLLVSSTRSLDSEDRKIIDWVQHASECEGWYFRSLVKDSKSKSPEKGSPVHSGGREVSSLFTVEENGLTYGIRFDAGYSVGLFPDQRQNRARLLRNDSGLGDRITPKPSDPSTLPILNLFSYTCSFSVCAASIGWRTFNVDLSRNYLNWGRENFRLNGLDPDSHEFIFGDASDWLGRFGRKKLLFSLIVLDPPTFSRARKKGHHQVRKGYPELVSLCLNVLKPGGILLACSNAAEWEPTSFVEAVQTAITDAGRKSTGSRFFGQPPDYHSTRNEPANLKTLWVRVD